VVLEAFDGLGERARQQYVVYVDSTGARVIEGGTRLNPDNPGCPPASCPPVGACCDPGTGVCTETVEGDCRTPDQWSGAGSMCDPNPCPEPCITPNSPAAASPRDGASLALGSGASVTTISSLVARCTSYQWELYRGSECRGAPYRSAHLPPDSAHVWDRLSIGEYAWRVRAVNDPKPGGCPSVMPSEWSDSHRFTLASAGGHCDFASTRGSGATIRVERPSRNGGPLEAGDILAAFDDDHGVWSCIGSTCFTGDLPIEISAMAPDPPLPGFAEGGPVRLELCTIEGDTLCGTAVWSEGGRYGAGLTSVASEAEFGECRTCERRTVLRYPRWEWISLGVTPADSLVQAVFHSLDGNLGALEDASGGVYAPGATKTLEVVRPDQAYRVFLAHRPDTLLVDGALPDSALSCFPIRGGQWNLIPYLTDACDPAGGLNVNEAFLSIAQCVRIVKDGDGRVWIPALDVNTLGRLDPRRAYALYSGCADIPSFCYPDSGSSGQPQYAPPAPGPVMANDVFGVQETGLPEIVVVDSWNDSSLGDGDEIGLYSGATAVGWARVGPAPLLVIPVWRADADRGLPGFVPGGELTARAWHRESGRTAPLEAGPADGEGVVRFVFEPYLRITLRAEDPGGAAEFRLLRVSPNPSRGPVEIRYEAPSAGPVLAEIFDASGRLVRRLEQEASGPGAHAIRWDGRTRAGHPAAGGTYFIRLSLGGQQRQERILVVPGNSGRD
jgi:hypothetical protein